MRLARTCYLRNIASSLYPWSFWEEKGIVALMRTYFCRPDPLRDFFVCLMGSVHSSRNFGVEFRVIFFFFWLHLAHGTCKCPGQGLSLFHNCSPSHSSENTGSLTSWAMRELWGNSFLFFINFFYGNTHSTWKFLGQGLNPSHSCSNARSLNPLQAGDQTHASAVTCATADVFLIHWATVETP